MAPDLNSVPTSPRPNITSHPSGSLSRESSTTASRRTSQIYPMSPPPLPLASPGGTLSASAQGHTLPPLSPSISGRAPSVDASGTPMRHPQPVTPAQIYLEMEKEQEAAVNRLTRELSALRTHSASVVSTGSIASSAASNAHIDNDSAHAGSMTGSMHPMPSRQRRSSSSVSRSGLPPGSYPHRYSVSSQQGGDPSHRSSSVVSTPRYEEVAQQRAELEDVKRENEMLKQRIRDLERAIRNGDADAQRGRRGAPASTTEPAAAGASAPEEGGTS